VISGPTSMQSGMGGFNSGGPMFPQSQTPMVSSGIPARPSMSGTCWHHNGLMSLIVYDLASLRLIDVFRVAVFVANIACQSVLAKHLTHSSLTRPSVTMFPMTYSPSMPL